MDYGKKVNQLGTGIIESVWELADGGLGWDDERYIKIFEDLGKISALVIAMKKEFDGTGD
jgi:hypothetical protein